MARRRLRRLDPVQQMRASFGMVLVGALVAGLGAYLRLNRGPGDSASAGYLLETAGLFLAVAGAAWQAKVSDILVLFEPGRVRRRAILSSLAGVVAALLGCIAASAIESDGNDDLVRAVTEGAIVDGIGFGLAGLLSLMWAFGLGYAAQRIQRLGEEDW